MVVHSRFEAPLPFFDQCVRGHRQDRKVIEPGIGSQQPGRRVAVHLRHLQVHQDDVEVGGGCGPFWSSSTACRPCGGNRDCGSLAFQQFLRDLLVHFVVFDQQDANAGCFSTSPRSPRDAGRRRRSAEPPPKRSISVSYSIEALTGFNRNASMPTCSACAAISSRPNAVTMTMRGLCFSRASRWMIALACRPSIPGICQSIRTSWYGSFESAAISFPDGVFARGDRVRAHPERAQGIAEDFAGLGIVVHDQRPNPGEVRDEARPRAPRPNRLRTMR